MIQSFEIKNFKSIKYLSLDCKRINLFIGEPNTGKSNILEAFGVISGGGHKMGAKNLKRFVRFKSMGNLFYDENLDEPVILEFKKTHNGSIRLEINYFLGSFKFTCWDNLDTIFELEYDYNGKSSGKFVRASYFFKFYRFTMRKYFLDKKPYTLLPPSGANLLLVLLHHKELNSLVGQLFKPYGLSLVFKPQGGRIEVQKECEDIIISYPYSIVSDTLQRVVFYLAAIYSNKDSVIVLEEPESHAFPYYTKYLAELIALDENKNQYFISTHNPYIVFSILEKAHKDDVQVFITYFEDYQTKVKPLSEGEKQEIMDMEMDLFFNIDRFLEKK